MRVFRSPVLRAMEMHSPDELEAMAAFAFSQEKVCGATIVPTTFQTLFPRLNKLSFSII